MGRAHARSRSAAVVGCRVPYPTMIMMSHT